MLWYSKVSLGATGSIILPFENLSAEDLAFVNDFVVDNLRSVTSGAGTLAAVRGYEAADRLPLVKARTLFIDSIGSVEAAFCQRAEELRKFVPGSRTAVIENGDIHVMITRPADLAALLDDFFSEVDASV